MSTEIATSTAFKAMQTDIQVSMDDVVSAFVSQYENNLYARKKELTASIKDVEGRLAAFIKKLHKDINGKSFIKVAMPFGLIADVGEGHIDWHKAKMTFQITITDKERTRYGNTITVNKTKKVPATTVKAHEKLVSEADGLRGELSEILVSLKSVARKERQVRGRIAVRKLEDSGYANLMKDSELAQLVQLD